MYNIVLQMGAVLWQSMDGVCNGYLWFAPDMQVLHALALQNGMT
jgi:hypothetical protein